MEARANGQWDKSRNLLEEMKNAGSTGAAAVQLKRRIKVTTRPRGRVSMATPSEPTPSSGNLPPAPRAPNSEEQPFVPDTVFDNRPEPEQNPVEPPAPADQGPTFTIMYGQRLKGKGEDRELAEHLWCDGHCYSKGDVLSNGHQRWRCKFTLVKKRPGVKPKVCNEVITTETIGDKRQIVGPIPEHLHDPQSNKFLHEKVNSKARQNAFETGDSRMRCITNAYNTVDRQLQPAAPGRSRIAKVHDRKRKIRNCIRFGVKKGEGNFSTPDKLDIPRAMATLQNEVLKLCTDGQGSDKIVLLGSRDMLDFINEYIDLLDMASSDGTFRTCPNIFSQHYNFGVKLKGHDLTLLHFLLNRKNRPTYKRVRRMLEWALNRQWPRHLMWVTDYEDAMIQELKAAGIDIQGCFFHFVQCINKALKAAGLWKKYNRDDYCRHRMYMLSSLAFLSPELIPLAYARLAETFTDEKECAFLKEYFERHGLELQPKPQCTQRLSGQYTRAFIFAKISPPTQGSKCMQV